MHIEIVNLLSAFLFFCYNIEAATVGVGADDIGDV